MTSGPGVDRGRRPGPAAAGPVWHAARTWLGWAVLALAALPVAALAWGWFGDPGLVWTHRLDRAGVASGLLALGLATIAVVLLTSGWSARAPLLVLCGIAVLVWTLAGALLRPPPTVATLEEPRGRYVALVVDVSLTRVVTIRQTGYGPRDRQWDAACLIGDSGTGVLQGLRWVGRDELRVRSDSGLGVITVDPSTGEPTRVSGRLVEC